MTEFTADPIDAMRHVLLNLISNAMKYTTTERPLVEIDVRPIESMDRERELEVISSCPLNALVRERRIELVNFEQLIALGGLC